MQELHFKQQGDRAREKEYAQIYGIIMDLLDKMVSILGEEEFLLKSSDSFWRPV